MGDDWRADARGYLNPADQQQLSSIKPKKLMRWLQVLVGLIRYAQAELGATDRVAITSDMLKEIAGTRRTIDSQRYDRQVLVDSAQELGFLGQLLVRGEKGKTATLYAVPRQ